MDSTCGRGGRRVGGAVIRFVARAVTELCARFGPAVLLAVLFTAPACEVVRLRLACAWACGRAR
eukprot:8770170-Lingulodinium_polyedra.AAC.1